MADHMAWMELARKHHFYPSLWTENSVHWPLLFIHYGQKIASVCHICLFLWMENNIFLSCLLCTFKGGDWGCTDFVLFITVKQIIKHC